MLSWRHALLQVRWGLPQANYEEANGWGAELAAATDPGFPDRPLPAHARPCLLRSPQHGSRPQGIPGVRAYSFALRQKEVSKVKQCLGSMARAPLPAYVLGFQANQLSIESENDQRHVCLMQKLRFTKRWAHRGFKWNPTLPFYYSLSIIQSCSQPLFLQADFPSFISPSRWPACPHLVLLKSGAQLHQPVAKRAREVAPAVSLQNR